jgi:hypothetical protein
MSQGRRSGDHFRREALQDLKGILVMDGQRNLRVDNHHTTATQPNTSVSSLWTAVTAEVGHLLNKVNHTLHSSTKGFPNERNKLNAHATARY